MLYLGKYIDTFHFCKHLHNFYLIIIDINLYKNLWIVVRVGLLLGSCFKAAITAE